MPVDVVTEIEIARLRPDVAAYAAAPDSAPVWYENIEGVEWATERPLAVGARLAFTAASSDAGSPTRTRSASSCPASGSS